MFNYLIYLFSLSLSSMNILQSIFVNFSVQWVIIVMEFSLKVLLETYCNLLFAYGTSGLNKL